MSGPGGAGCDDPAYHLQQVRRAQLRDATSQLCQGETKKFKKLFKYFVQIFSAHFCRPQGRGRMNIN